jgi:RimJ/RimL family protein N-acetyltransferase
VKTEPLRTDRLNLEPVRPLHALEAWPLLNDDRMWQYFPALRPATPDDLRALYEKWERGSGNQSEVWLNWLCRDRALGALVGGMQSTVFTREGVAYVAYAVYPQHQRNGYARESVRAILDYVAKTFAVKRFFAEMDTRNEASFRLAESLGFTRVEMHAAIERGHGIDADEYLYQLDL